jgi:magnesium chelatase subunit D
VADAKAQLDEALHLKPADAEAHSNLASALQLQGRLAEPDLRGAVRQQKAGNLVVLALDASGSMGAEQRMEAAKGAVLGLLLDAYQRRDRVAVVCFGARRPRSSCARPAVEVAGPPRQPADRRPPRWPPASTPPPRATAAGPAATHRPLLVLVTDGRATAGSASTPSTRPWRRPSESGAGHRRRRGGRRGRRPLAGPRLGLAARLATALGARYLPLRLTADTLRSTS